DPDQAEKRADPTVSEVVRVRAGATQFHGRSPAGGGEEGDGKEAGGAGLAHDPRGFDAGLDVPLAGPANAPRVRRHGTDGRKSRALLRACSHAEGRLGLS